MNKITIISLLGATILATSATASFADSSSLALVQVGNGSLADIAMKGVKNNTNVNVQGNSVSTKVAQTGNQNSTLVKTVGSKGVFTTSQIGNNDSINISAKGDFNKALVTQHGSQDKATVSINGGSNGVSVVQDGDYQDASVTIGSIASSSGNSVGVTQAVGGGNKSAITLDGVNNVADSFQTGIRNSLDASVNTNNSRVNSRQVGNLNVAHVKVSAK